MNFPNWREWLYSGKAFIAAMLALYIALVIPLPNPYWSVATVYIVSHPLSGATRSKAIYRVFGTVLGAIAAVALVPNFVDSPILLTLLIGCWTGSLLFLALLDRSPRGYVFMLSAYTMPLIALPTLVDPGQIFDVALARSEEILLGIVCASVVNTALFPSQVSPVLGNQMANMLRDAATWAGERLDIKPPYAAPQPVRHRMLTDVVSMDVLIKQLSYDTANHAQAEHARQMRLRMTMLIPQVAALFDPLYVLGRRAGQLPADIAALVTRTTSWMRQGDAGDEQIGDALREDVAQRIAHLPATRSIEDVLTDNAMHRLGELVDLWQDCLGLQRAYRHSATSRPPVLQYRTGQSLSGTRHYDYLLLAFGAGSAAMATVVASLLWIYSGWTSGASAIVLVAVACSFFAATDEPAPQIGRFLYWESMGIAFALIYLFAILPNIHTFFGLSAVLAIPLLFAGAFTGRPQFNMSVLLFTSQAISDLSLSNAYAANFESFTNNSLASLLGLIFALIWTVLTKPFGAEFAARRLARASWRDLATLARKATPDDRRRLTARMLDRTCQILPRLGLVKDQSLANMDAVRDVRLCLRLIELHELRTQLDAANASQLKQVLKQLTAYFQQCSDRGTPLPPPDSLRDQLDTAIGHLLPLHDDASRKAAQAMVGLRLALFLEPPSERPAPAAGILPTDPTLGLV